jgi:hypothetical protein
MLWFTMTVTGSMINVYYKKCNNIADIYFQQYSLTTSFVNQYTIIVNLLIKFCRLFAICFIIFYTSFVFISICQHGMQTIIFLYLIVLCLSVYANLECGHGHLSILKVKCFFFNVLCGCGNYKGAYGFLSWNHALKL